MDKCAECNKAFPMQDRVYYENKRMCSSTCRIKYVEKEIARLELERIVWRRRIRAIQKAYNPPLWYA